MNKTAILLSVVLVSGLVSVKILDLGLEEPLDAWAEEQRVEEKFVSYRCFKVTFEATLADLESGQVRLKEAHARVCAAARRYHPAYFADLYRSESGGTDDERVAQNLVGHITDLGEMAPRSRARYLDLKCQLRELLAEMNSASRAPLGAG